MVGIAAILHTHVIGSNGIMGQPREVAAAAVFLASDESSFSTGMELRVGGGHAGLQHPPKTSRFWGVMGKVRAHKHI